MDKVSYVEDLPEAMIDWWLALTVMDTLPESVYFILAGQDVASAWLWRPWGLYPAFCFSLLMRFF